VGNLPAQPSLTKDETHALGFSRWPETSHPMEALHGPDRSPQHSASIPIVIIYVLFLDCYVSALTAGAVKG